MLQRLNTTWDLNLETKPDSGKAMERIYAWFEGEIIDRAPVRFTAHNSFISEKHSKRKWSDLKSKWFDVEFQVHSFLDTIKHRKFLGETFPVYWPNLGPNVFASFYGCHLEFAELTSWAIPCINDWEDLNKLELNIQSEYFKKLEEFTLYAMEHCDGHFLVGYTDLHPGMDCVAAWRGSQELCLDLYDHPEEVKAALHKSSKDFQQVYDHFDCMLKKKKQLSVSWMEIPSFGKLHIPSCDFSAMISNKQFIEYCLPLLQEEVKPMNHNIFHLDGKDCARHIDTILEVKEIQSIQWVQGDGDKPIMQWIPLIKKIQASGKSVVVDLEADELDSFIDSVKPEGIMLCIPVYEEEHQRHILKMLEKWK